MDFSNAIIDNGSILPMPWRIAENYLNCGQKAYRANILDHKGLCVVSVANRASHLSIALKILSYIILFPLALIALAVKAGYRKSYTINKIFTFSQEMVQPRRKPADAHPYSLDRVIDRVKAAKATGLKVALFIGRNTDETMPREDGWTWFSLDRACNENFCDEHHLQMNVNDEDRIRKISQLFNKVVVDNSVLKFILTPWKALHSLLVPDRESMLITEAWSGGASIELFKKLKLDPAEATMSFSHLDTAATHLPRLIKAINGHLQQYFHQVDAFEGCYPYRGDRVQGKGWILRDPKPIRS